MTDNPLLVEESDDFDFEQGDTVVVRHREHGTTGNIVAKFEAEVSSFRDGVPGGSDKVRLALPWGDMTTMSSNDAEFEVKE